MGLLSRLLVKNYSLSDWIKDTRLWIGGSGIMTNAGVKVDELSAMRFITVYSCVRVLAETYAMLPRHVVKDRPNGGHDKVPSHPVYGLLHDQPNEEMTAVTYFETTLGHRILSGNEYSIIEHNRRGQVMEIYPVPWTDMEPRRNSETMKIEYHLNDRGKDEVLPSEKVLHIPGLGFDGVKGYSTIQMNRDAVGLGKAASEFAQRFYGQGMNVGGVLEHPGALSDPAYERLRTDMENRGAGLANSWKPLILEEGMKFSRIPMTMIDAQFIEIMKFTDEQLCGMLGVPPHMVARLERSTNNNIEHQGIEYVMYSLMPHIVRAEQAQSRKLFTRSEREQGYRVRTNANALLRGDYESQQKGLAIQRQNGIINGDEWREFMEMNPQDGNTGKVYLVNGNMVSVETAAKQQPRKYTDRNGGDGNEPKTEE